MAGTSEAFASFYPRAQWGAKECGNYKNVFTYRLITVGSKEERVAFIQGLISALWTVRYKIRFEAHGIPQPSSAQNIEEAEYFDTNTLPVTWTKWLNLPDAATQDASLTVKDAVVTDMDVDLTRQNSRKQSPALHAILDASWLSLKALGGEEDTKKMELLTVKGDVTKLQRIMTFTIDGFETEDGSLDTTLVSTLRDFVLYFMHNPTSDSASGFNSYIKKRVAQWYSWPPGGDQNASSTSLPVVKLWNVHLVRTPATRNLTKLLEARRFYARSHRPMDVSYNRVSGICKILINSKDIWKKAVALMFALGTRPNELFRSFVHFFPLPDDEQCPSYVTDKHKWITQLGTSKCSNATQLILEPGRPGVDDRRLAFKPILFGFTCHDAIEVINQLRMEADKDFRESVLSGGLSLDEAPTSAITLTVVQKLTRTMYSLFQEEGDDCTARGHLFGGLFSRKFYACAALMEFREAYIDRTTPNQFVSEILMHQPGMPTDSVHYVTLRLKYGDEDSPFVYESKEDGDGEFVINRKKEEPETGDSKKKRRRSVTKDDNALFSQTDDIVTLKTLEKKEKVQVNRFTHRKFQSEDERQEYFEAVKQFLLSKGIRPSIANLTAIGVSPQFQSARKKHFKDAVKELERVREEADVIQMKVDELGEEVKEFGEGDEVDGDTEDDECDDGSTDGLTLPKLKRQKAMACPKDLPTE